MTLSREGIKGDKRHHSTGEAFGQHVIFSPHRQLFMKKLDANALLDLKNTPMNLDFKSFSCILSTMFV